MITERTLRQWRREALQAITYRREGEEATPIEKREIQISERILRLTQDLMDFHLMKKG